MKILSTVWKRLAAPVAVGLLYSATAVANFPAGAGCDPATWPASADPAGLQSWCADNPLQDCSLEIVNGDIRIGDSASTAGGEKPRFFFDAANNRFYTKLFVKFDNDGVGPAPADHATVPAADRVQVNFSFREPPAVAWTPAGTVHLGTMRSSYAMRIPPPAGASVGALGQGETHA
ncbi:MAG: hypothetical protein GY906_15240, partial [bacterium]|nr:hypothetical protein [bacterium]